LPDPQAPVWTSVHLRNAEAFGAGTLARDPDTGALLPHIHASLGLKEHSATAHTSHLLAATVQFLVELVVVEVTAPKLLRVRNPDLYDVPLLTFES
jgi:predicted DNA-binding protein with PD1-like motif